MSTATAQTELAKQYIELHNLKQQKIIIEQKTFPKKYTSLPEGMQLKTKMFNVKRRIDKFEALLKVKK